MVVVPILLIVLAAIFAWIAVQGLITGEVTLYKHTAGRRDHLRIYVIYIAFYVVFGAFALLYGLVSLVPTTG